MNNMAEKKNLPEIRFKGFKEEWEKKDFIDIVDKRDGIRRGPFGSSIKKDMFVPKSDYVVYEQQNAIYDRYETRYNITKEKYDELIKFKIDAGDYIMSGAGTIGRISRVPNGIKKGVFNQALIRIKLNSEVIDSEYFLQWMRSDDMQHRLTEANPASAMVNLVPMAEVKKWNIHKPKIVEQSQIGTYFKHLDHLITLHQSKYDMLVNVKKVMLEKMFPKKGEDVPEIRFKGFTGAWEKRKLGEMTDYKNGKGHEDRQVAAGKYELINLNSISIDGGLKLSGKFIDETDTTLKINDLVMVLSDVAHGNLLGRVALIPENDRFVLNQRIALLRSNQSQSINPIFLLYNINAHQNYFKSQGAGMSQLNISKNSVENFTLLVPSLVEEQSKIGTFFKHLDHLLALQQQELEKLKNIKKACLEKMFV